MIAKPDRAAKAGGGFLAMLENDTRWTFEGQRGEGPWLLACGRWRDSADAVTAAKMWFDLVVENGEAGGIRIRQIEEITAC